MKMAAACAALAVTAGIAFASSASASQKETEPNKETTAAAFAEAANRPDKLTETEFTTKAWASVAKKAAGSFAGSAAWDYVKANTGRDMQRLAENRKGAFIRGEVAGTDVHTNVNFSRAFD
ncbi:hypothetical protein ABZZ17_19655 [Streptomyces sp. NPDC006512]|uniref:hypothetical protein n=1 Tax=Streptomyces sp. NPDC006512 TaxID=3154307 RepID=UPI00339F8673